MNLKKKILLVFCFFIYLTLSAQTVNQKKLIEEYNALLNRVRYSKHSGFCFDGQNFITEIKTKGNEHSFFLDNKTIYLKVVNVKTGETYFTRCFELSVINGVLAVNKNYRLEQNIRVKDDWSFFRLGKNLNLSICSGTTCKNISLDLYEIIGKPLSVKDGLFLTFPKGTEKQAFNVNPTVNYKAIPEFDLAKEQKNAKSLMGKIRANFSENEALKMQKDLDEVFKTLK
ncbi:MAG: hypothetical protein P1P64_10235 [Treponemataceae bacterium]